MKTGVAVLLLAVILTGCRQTPRLDVERIAVVSSDTLSVNGSTRATSYSMSVKIIRAQDKLFVTWLDHVADIQIKCYDLKTDTWSETILLGTGVDNHAGPALTLDSQGYLWAVFGPHHGPFQFRRSARPYCIDEWLELPDFGDTATYPSLVCDAEDQLHLTYRGLSQPWKITYQRRPSGGEWSEPRALVSAAADTGYTHFGNPLAVSAEGVLHLAFHTYDLESRAGQAIGYMRSRDNGDTWENAEGQPLELPASPDSPCIIERGDTLDMRVNSLVLDPQGEPWILSTRIHENPRTTRLWHRENGEWQTIDLLPVVREIMPTVEVLYGSHTFSADGTLWVATTVQPAGTKLWWGGDDLETVLLVSADRGKSWRLLPVSTPAQGVPSWQPSIERPYSHRPVGIPALLYTFGGVGVGVTGGDATRVVFTRFDVQ
ncbi:BNR-4 repeat-containing protein [candidate division KSB1 bacterium]|nr:BNR-4 repeat-containing protein [candidate division KSB1 bacterium]